MTTLSVCTRCDRYGLVDGVTRRRRALVAWCDAHPTNGLIPESMHLQVVVIRKHDPAFSDVFSVHLTVIGQWFTWWFTWRVRACSPLRANVGVTRARMSCSR